MDNLSLMTSEIVWVEEESHENMLPECHEDMVTLKEETPASFGHAQSLEQSIEENICTSEETLASIKCKDGWDSEVHEMGVLDMKEDIIENENTLASPLEKAMRVPSAVSDSQSGEIVTEASYTLIGETHYCRPCDIQFHSQTDFSIHIIKTHKRMNRFQCPKCEKDFKYWSKLLEHFVIHSEVTSYTLIGEDHYCRPCDIQFHSQTDFSIHIIKTHKRMNRFQCPKCEKDFRYWSKLLEHYVTHSEARSYKCKICHKQFLRNGDVKKHIAVHSDSRPFSCNICDRQFKRLPGVRRHMITHYKKHFCYQCSELFNSKEELTRHIPSAHPRRSNNTFQCPECPKSFSYSSKLLEHMDSHSKWNHGCSICKKIFPRRSGLTRHMQEHASDSTSVTSKTLRMPRGRKVNYPCKFCGKVFRWMSKLEEHIRKHTKEKVFACDVCNKGFSTKSGLKYHMPKHTGDLLYSCPVCKKKFACNSGVSSHIRIHYVLDPFGEPTIKPFCSSS